MTRNACIVEKRPIAQKDGKIEVNEFKKDVNVSMFVSCSCSYPYFFGS